MSGNLIRTLSLGLQPAGFYRSRASAAYWDGRNDLGGAGFERRLFLPAVHAIVPSDEADGDSEIGLAHFGL